MDRKGFFCAAFLVVLLAWVLPVAGDVDHDHEAQQEILTVNGYQIELVTKPEVPKAGTEVELQMHIEHSGQSVSDLHVETQISKMEMHSDDMEEHVVLHFEEGHTHEEDSEPGHYVHHFTFDEPGTYMIRVRIEDVGVSEPYNITVESSFSKDIFTAPLIYAALSIGIGTVIFVWTRKSGT